MNIDRKIFVERNAREKFPKTPNIDGDVQKSREYAVTTKDGLLVARFARVVNMFGDTTRVLSQGWFHDGKPIDPLMWLESITLSEYLAEFDSESVDYLEKYSKEVYLEREDVRTLISFWESIKPILVQKEVRIIELENDNSELERLHNMATFNVMQLQEENSKLKEEMENIRSEANEPYFGWCDVEGCENEGCSGGAHWRESGYWTICSKHSRQCRDGSEQPKMKQGAVSRENSRKPDGTLP